MALKTHISNSDIYEAIAESEIIPCFPAVKEIRPHLSEDVFKP